MPKTSFGFDRRVVPGSTSVTLISQLKQRHEDGWVELSEHYGPLIYRWSRQSGLSPDDSADIVQEVFRSVTKNIRRFQKATVSDTFRGWLRIITKHKILDHLRRQMHRPRSTGGTDAHIRFLATIDEHGRARRDSAVVDAREVALHEALDSLRSQFSDRTWRAFWMSILDQFTSSEIASELSMSPSAVRLAKSRILRRLREIMADHNVEPIPPSDI